MDKLEVLFANNRAIICFYFIMAGFLILYSKTIDIHIRQVFCLSRKRNMEYARKRGLVSAICFGAAEITVYEILSLVLGYAHITPMLTAFFFTGAVFVVFWMYRCTLVKNVAQVLIGMGLLMCTPFVIMILIIRCNVEFDRYLGYVAVVLAFFAAGQYKGFVNGWKKEDLA